MQSIQICLISLKPSFFNSGACVRYLVVRTGFLAESAARMANDDVECKSSLYARHFRIPVTSTTDAWAEYPRRHGKRGHRIKQNLPVADRRFQGTREECASPRQAKRTRRGGRSLGFAHAMFSVGAPCSVGSCKAGQAILLGIVELDGGGETGDKSVDRLAEAAAPGLVGFLGAHGRTRGKGRRAACEKEKVCR